MSEEKKNPDSEEQMTRMTLGVAYAIFQQINDPEIPDEWKGLAILKIANMETHNSITKEMMLNAIKYLLPLAFDITEAEDNG